MAHNLKDLEDKIKATEVWLTEEYFGIRTGRATPVLLDGISVNAYGSNMPLHQVASISIEDVRTLRISPYDTSQTKEIEGAISKADLGVSVGSDERGVRVFFPELTSERRAQLMRLVKEKLEEARISLKKLREETWEDIQKKEKTKEISEDDKFRAKEDMQKLIDAGNQQLDVITAKKEKELLS